MGFILVPFIIIIITMALIIIFKAIKIVPESRVYIIEKLGKYDQSLSSGLNFINPFFDKVSRVVSLKEQVVDFPPQPVITKDNATMQIDTIVYFQITDPKLYTYGIERPISAIENLTATTLRNIIGDMTVDQTLTSRDIINTNMRVELDEATDPWGIKVNRVELKSIIPPADIRSAMEKEMKAEREKRANILEAQAKRESAILVAEGEKQAAILRAEAKKEQQIKEAEGEAEAILSIQRAKAEALRLLKEAAPNAEVLSLKGMETFEKVADGKSTKIIIPSNMQNLASMVTAFAELNEKQGNSPEKK
ncbi:SPFH/Band 7/PHB domain protein [Leptotrichia sp. OH3620_COT-345]|uniref:SPFH domain-containing protein n=1 Tax=Leptotrichia sp. OH3620_COT-345 TaxID=2491048 RepID=UPI000F6553C7|nr:SPFH domain-containing protein [Leptotrichia sp. OH3620_COT-345]RRD40483.1 SPFH/Band 7/PHB domain protein [Leptotrichia sp. OH3620_COT-345]